MSIPSLHIRYKKILFICLMELIILHFVMYGPSPSPRPLLLCCVVLCCVVLCFVSCVLHSIFYSQLEENGKREAEELEAARTKYEKSLLVRCSELILCPVQRHRIHL
jgi:hypothetical protein